MRTFFSIQERIRCVGDTAMHISIFLKWITFGIIIISFTGCATSRTGAVVEDRSMPEESQQQKQSEQHPRVYKLEEPETVTPEPLQETTVEDRTVQTQNEQLAVQQSSPAVVALLDDADHYAVSGKKQEAVASIERAIRIEPKNPLLWHKLGQLHLQQGKWEQAIAMAKKSNVLATGNQSLQADNWMIIAKARDAMGDKQGAAEAFNMAHQLQY